MTEKVILEAISKIEPELFWMVVKLFGVGIVLLILKGYVENIAAYLQFRFDRRLGIGVEIKVRGVEGKIINYTFSWIFIRTEEGVILVAIKRWRFEAWQLLNEKED